MSHFHLLPIVFCILFCVSLCKWKQIYSNFLPLFRRKGKYTLSSTLFFCYCVLTMLSVCKELPYSFLQPYSIDWYTITNLFNEILLKEMSCVHSFAVVNNATMNNSIHMSFCSYAGMYSIFLKVGLLGLRANAFIILSF